MCKFLVFTLLLISLLGCKKDEQNITVKPEGVYNGTFKRELVWGESDTANITMTFSANTWTGTSDKIKYPALCKGTYTIVGDTIIFKNECEWTAEFDWSLILSGKYILKSTGNTIEFYRDYRSATSDTYVDRYKIKNQPFGKSEVYNTEYNIMFPDTYVGGIHQEASGATFYKSRNDNKVMISGGFCDERAYPCLASEYAGETLENLPDSITYTNLNGQPAYLNKRIVVNDNQNTIVCLYYTNSSGGTFRNSYGRLYLRTCSNSCYRMAGVVEFASSEQQELIEIIKTLKQK